MRSTPDINQLLKTLTSMPTSIHPPSSTAAPADPTPTATAKGLFDLAGLQEAADNELLRHRFLCRGGSLLIVGNTGIGKSSLTMQMMVRWALGQACFGIHPARPLSSLLIQGENDEQDLVEMRDGVIGALALTQEQQTQINQQVRICHEYERSAESFATEVLEPLLSRYRPALVWIDPVLQYLGGDANQQEVVSEFLRCQISPLIKGHHCAVVMIHHTNKPSQKAGQRRSPNLSAYDGAGSAEFSNWPRAVLSLQATQDRMQYRLVGAKRGGRLRWRMPDEVSPCFEKLLCHSRQPGLICWEEVETDAQPITPEGRAGQAAGPDPEDDLTTVIMAHVPATGSLEKKVLVAQVKAGGIGENRVVEAVKRLLADGTLLAVEVRRAKIKPASHVRRPDPGPPAPSPPVALPKPIVLPQIAGPIPATQAG